MSPRFSAVPQSRTALTKNFVYQVPRTTSPDIPLSDCLACPVWWLKMDWDKTVGWDGGEVMVWSSRHRSWRDKTQQPGHYFFITQSTVS